MVFLPLANILHHKFRSALSALGVGIGVCMLITLLGLSRGSLEEVAERWEVVDADLIVYPAKLTSNITTISGGGLAEGDVRAVRQLTAGGQACVRRIVPIFLHRVRIGDSEHNVVGAAPEDLPALLGGRSIARPGRVFDPDNRFRRWLEGALAGGPDDDVLEITQAQLARHGGLEMVIDTRLARDAGLKLGSKVHAAGHRFDVVGVVPAGGLARAFMPLATAQLLGAGGMGRYTLLFVKLRQGADLRQAIAAIRATGRLSAMALGEYRAMLQQRFGIMYVYVDVVNAVTLVVAFLFILVTLYTTVIQRRREIAILRSMGATRGYILGEVAAESAILTACGTAAGVAMSFGAAAAIEAARPLLTVTITWGWILIAGAAAGAGAAAAAIYPAVAAVRTDVVAALTLE